MDSAFRFTKFFFSLFIFFACVLYLMRERICARIEERQQCSNSAYQQYHSPVPSIDLSSLKSENNSFFSIRDKRIFELVPPISSPLSQATEWFSYHKNANKLYEVNNKTFCQILVHIIMYTL